MDLNVGEGAWWVDARVGAGGCGKKVDVEVREDILGDCVGNEGGRRGVVGYGHAVRGRESADEGGQGCACMRRSG